MSEKSLIELKNIVEKQPDNKLARYSLANEFYKSEMYIDAIDELKKYLEINEDEGAAYRMLAYSYEELGEKQKAIDAWKDGIKAAEKHGHSSMAEEFQEQLERLAD